MKLQAVTLSLAIFSVTLASGFTPASASRMDGKCCMSSDHGASHRYWVAIRRGYVPYTCSAYADSCIRLSSTHADRFRMCMAAKAQCMMTGVHVGPYSHGEFAGLQKL
jgi:hypothetical protein